MLRIAFLALSQAHQYLHWIPAALRLSQEPGIEVTVLGASDAGLNFIRSYDSEGSLHLRKLWVPSLARDSLFSPPKRKLTLLIHHREISRYDAIVTTETTSSFLYRVPGFSAQMIHLKHGAGDREGGYNPKHARFDLTRVHGAKDKQRLIARGLVTEDNCLVVGYAKFELAPPPAAHGRNCRTALYNPHFDRRVSSWFSHGQDIVRAMEQIPEWDFVIAPHVKTRDGRGITSSRQNIAIDMGSPSSIDMTYTEQSDVYIGDASSQVYEFLRRPRPCIFTNFDRIDWRGNENYAHWNLGQVIEQPEDLRSALDRASEVQPEFEDRQRAALAHSIDSGLEPASERQARAILTFARQTSGRPFMGDDYLDEQNFADRTRRRYPAREWMPSETSPTDPAGDVPMPELEVAQKTAGQGEQQTLDRASI